MSNPDWRKIEFALVQVLEAEGFSVEQERGEYYVWVGRGPGDTIEINLSDFAKQLEERL